MKIYAFLVKIIMMTVILASCNQSIPANETSMQYSSPIASTIESEKVTEISWKGIHYGQSFFDLFIVVNGKNYYIGNFFGENLWQYEDPENILTHFRGIWTGAGSDFYVKRKNEAEIAIMYHEIPYKSDPYEYDEYDEILTITIDKGNEIQVNRPNIYKGMNEDSVG